MTPLPPMQSAMGVAVPPGKFILYPDRDGRRFGFTTHSVSGAPISDVIMFPVKDGDPDETWRIWPINQISDTVLVLEGLQIQLNPRLADVNFNENQSYTLGRVYLMGDDLVVCAATPEKHSRFKGRLFKLATGEQIEGYKGAVVSFGAWELSAPGANQSMVLLYNPAAP